MNNNNIFRSFDQIDAGYVSIEGKTIAVFDIAPATPVYQGTGTVIEGRHEWTPMKWADDAIVVLRRHEGWCSLVAEGDEGSSVTLADFDDVYQAFRWIGSQL